MSHPPDSQSVNAEVVTQEQPSEPSVKNNKNNDTLPFDILCEILAQAGQMSWRESPLWGTERLESFDESLTPSYFEETIHDSCLSRVEPMLVPIRLSQVCRSWNYAAIACPAVWANIDVPFGGREDKKRAEWYIKAVDNCIQRSKAAPLSLSFSCACYHETRGAKPIRDAVERVLKKLLNHQHRWRQAYFTFGEWKASSATTIELLDVPLLETFSICWRASLPSARQIYIDTSHSPKLRSLHIGGLPHIETSDGNLSSVTELTYPEDSGYQHGRVPLLEIIQQVPNLESLTFLFFQGLEGHENLQYPPTSLYKLHTLEFDTSKSSAFIISKLILPTLQRLICHQDKYSAHIQSWRSLNTFRQPLPSVEYLDVIGFEIVDYNLAPFIELLPNLKSLRMIGIHTSTCIGISPDFFDVLSMTRHPEVISRLGMSAQFCVPISRNFVSKIITICGMQNVRCKALDLVASVACCINDDDAHVIDQHFYVPFAGIDRKEVLETFKRASQLLIRFMKRSEFAFDPIQIAAEA
ncbi:uncharacterized protein FOMMEDRAFT_30565 [Fomitiporia mediterranea MF3/22]|uniref:uncharacterized protein n=1 Tax=Fomitiporia mediterranea (strain MF3/22) TaxID=694068 RepID=UPI0004408269|nr:uncharacterized protein FOMMEDRAFT_30565 [Fomitiporia mediterranea MF3/22]EJD00571.1 hypothetical protein FOMMEDRAFT_30565 [Fomitiporia mediterranea MF3/22]